MNPEELLFFTFSDSPLNMQQANTHFPTCHKQQTIRDFLSLWLFFIIDNYIPKCPVSNPTNSIAMETVIMYVLMWGVEIDMGEKKGGDTVKHVSEYQSLSHAVNNDSTAALCLLLKPCWSPRVAKETVNEINLQFHVRRLRGDLEKRDRRTRRDDFRGANIQLWNYLCPAYSTCTVHTQNSDGWGAVSFSSFFPCMACTACFCCAIASRNSTFNCNEKQF